VKLWELTVPYQGRTLGSSHLPTIGHSHSVYAVHSNIVKYKVWLAWLCTEAMAARMPKSLRDGFIGAELAVLSIGRAFQTVFGDPLNNELRAFGPVVGP
jgi:hypothetical protein